MIKMKRDHFRSKKAKSSISVELLAVTNARYPGKGTKTGQAHSDYFSLYAHIFSYLKLRDFVIRR